MVAVGEVRWEGVLRIVREQHGGTPAPDVGHEVSTQRPRIVHLTVRLAQEGDLHDPQEVRRLARLLFAALHNGGGSRRGIARPFVARRHQQQTDRRPRIDGAGQRAGAPRLDIVGVCGDGQHRDRSGWIDDHAPHPARPWSSSARCADSPTSTRLCQRLALHTLNTLSPYSAHTPS